MITSTASGPVLDKLRRISGPNPEGSKLTETERLHLIGLIGLVQVSQRIGQREAAKAVLRDVLDQLGERGMTSSDVKDILRDHEDGGPTAVVNAIAVHSSLCEPYLD